jgi:hypothetical protein
MWATKQAVSMAALTVAMWGLRQAASMAEWLAIEAEVGRGGERVRSVG